MVQTLQVYDNNRDNDDSRNLYLICVSGKIIFWEALPS